MKDNIILRANPEVDKNIYYATQFDAPDPFTYFRFEEKEYLLVTDLELERAKQESPIENIISFNQLSKQLKVDSQDFYQAFPTLLKHLIGSLNSKKFTVPENFPLLVADQLREEGVQLKAKPDPFFPERVIKNEKELKNIKEVEEAVNQVYHQIADIFKETKIKENELIYQGTPLTSEFIKDFIFIELYKKRCVPIGTIVSSGIDAAYPHCQGSGPLLPHTFIIIDIFPRSLTHFYFGDMTRTFVVGEPTDQMRKQYEAVRVSQEWACKEIKEGVTGDFIHNKILDQFKEVGFETGEIDGMTQGFFHGTGHGLGLDIHESPRISFNTPALKAGQVVTVEPGLYYKDTGGVRIEDLGVVTASGFELFSSFPRELLSFKG